MKYIELISKMFKYLFNRPKIEVYNTFLFFVLFKKLLIIIISLPILFDTKHIIYKII